MNNVGDKCTFYYVARHWTDDNGNPVEMDSWEEWEDLIPAQECAKDPPEGMTICVIRAVHEVIEVHNGKKEQAGFV